MTFTMTVNMDNAAFEDDAEAELRRILSGVCRQIPRSINGWAVIHDSNGNRVGEWSIA